MPLSMQLYLCGTFIAGAGVGGIYGYFKGVDHGSSMEKAREQVRARLYPAIEQESRQELLKATLNLSKADHESPNHVCTQFCPGNKDFKWFNK